MKCAILVFGGLFSEPHNTQIMKLLYRTAEWHTLAKLQMHSDSTLTLLEDLTVEFGKLMHQFCDLTCSQFQMVELLWEEATRCWRQMKQQATTSSSASPTTNSLSKTPPSGHSWPQSSSGSGQKAKSFNLFTIQFHFLGDYVCHIHLFGTMDSFSTQLVCNFNPLQTNLTILFRESSPINLWSGSMASQTRKMWFNKSEKVQLTASFYARPRRTRERSQWESWVSQWSSHYFSLSKWKTWFVLIFWS